MNVGNGPWVATRGRRLDHTKTEGWIVRERLSHHQSLDVILLWLCLDRIYQDQRDLVSPPRDFRQWLSLPSIKRNQELYYFSHFHKDKMNESLTNSSSLISVIKVARYAFHWFVFRMVKAWSSIKVFLELRYGDLCINGSDNDHTTS